MVYRRAHKENEIDENCEPVLSEPKVATQLRVTLTIDGTNP
jgi:hypothetical protein